MESSSNVENFGLISIWLEEGATCMGLSQSEYDAMLSKSGTKRKKSCKSILKVAKKNPWENWHEREVKADVVSPKRDQILMVHFIKGPIKPERKRKRVSRVQGIKSFMSRADQ